MNRRSGFTLMELLLVVAVLAIVAAAAAPTFFGGAKQAMEDAQRASFMSCWTTTVGGTNTFLSLAAAKGVTPTNGSLVTQSANTITFVSVLPDSARNFKTPKGFSNTLVPQFNGTSVNVLVTGNTTVFTDVDTAWAYVKNL